MVLSGITLLITIDYLNTRSTSTVLNASVTYSTSYNQRLKLESWHTNLEQEPLNRCHELPAP